MSKPISVTDAIRFALDRSGLPGRGKRPTFRTADYRKMLSGITTRPLSQHAFLKKLLKRAAMTGAPTKFPVVNHAALNLVDHT